MVQKEIKTISIRTLLEWYDGGKLNFHPDYQRDGNVWDTNRKQNFVFTLLNNTRYVIPTLYMNKKPSGPYSYMYEIVDGKQRITTIIEFIRGMVLKQPHQWEAAKTRLKVPKIAVTSSLYDDARHIIGLQGKSFDKLDADLQNLVLDAELSVTLFQDYNESTMRNIFALLQEGVSLNQGEKLKAMDTQLSKAADKICSNESGYAAMFERIKPNHKRAYWNKTVLHLLALVVQPSINTSFKPMSDLLPKTTDPSIVTNADKVTRSFLSFIEKVVSLYDDKERIARLYNEVQLIGLFTVWNRGGLNGMLPEEFKDTWACFIEDKGSNDTYLVETQQGSNQQSSRMVRADIIQEFFSTTT